MCRLLFNRQYFNNAENFHSNPNNAGVEVEPLFCQKTNSRISFQAKYFSSRVGYGKIRESIDKVVNHYRNEIDLIVLYCNKNIDTTAPSYVETIKIAKDANIKIELITDTAILDRVIEYPIISDLFFGTHSLNKEWFEERLDISLKSLGNRYNYRFNVETKTEQYIDLFCKNDKAIKWINSKKSEAIKKIKENRWKYETYKVLIKKIIETIAEIPDVEFSNIIDCLKWSNVIKSQYSDEFCKLEKELIEKTNMLYSREEPKDSKLLEKTQKEAREIEFVLSIPELLGFNNIEKNLLKNKSLILKGGFGVGKSQAFAVATKRLIDSDGFSLLILGGTFTSDDFLLSQIPAILGKKELGIDEILNILECLGEVNQQNIVLFIDAINESKHKSIWKTGLFQLIEKIEKLNYVRIALSVREGFEPYVLDESVVEKMKRNETVSLTHYGFREKTAQAMRTFLNKYGIPFSPTYFLQHEMTNPLFLKFFCETYSGENEDIYTLFDKLIKKSDAEALTEIGINNSSNILIHLIREIASCLLKENKKFIKEQELYTLSFWDIYGLKDKKLDYMHSLLKSGMFISFVKEDEVYYYFGYEYLQDYIMAKVVFEEIKEKDKLKTHLKDSVLCIEDGHIKKHQNIGLFVVACSLYAEKFGEEFIDFWDEIKDDRSVKKQLVDSYTESFLWRKTSSININNFVEFINSNKVRPDIVWRVFIDNSTKKNHPLNADNLHNLLFKMKLNHRDYLWTEHINCLADEDERLFQLVDYYEKGNSFAGENSETMRLLLILFAWLLTSSNRILRDKASKAMVEILKIKFELCLPLLQNFEGVNDPYVFQRLYAVIFGACMKRKDRQEDNYKRLAEYVYQNIFDVSKVYPDILLRDYARLIIERFLFEFKEINTAFDIKKINPPYNSDPIPQVTKETYLPSNLHTSGWERIVHSMIPDGVKGLGMYGDFGRYVFQSSIENFKNIDIENIYHYSIQFIRDELGYTDKLFDDYDSAYHMRSFDRSNCKKVERIGKKYQWIALYNILARIADQNTIETYDESEDVYKGTWQLYIRDFDPTININMLFKEIPFFENDIYDIDFLDEDDVCDISKLEKWLENGNKIIDSYPETFLIKDDDGTTWVKLKRYCSSRKMYGSYDDYDVDRIIQECWMMAHGYFVRKDDFDAFKKSLKNANFMGRWFPEPHTFHNLYNREYPWSSGSGNTFKEEWLEYEVETEETETVKYTNWILPEWGYHPETLIDDNDESDNMGFFLTEKEYECQRPIKKTIGNILPSYSSFSWDAEYDASQEETTSFDIPCVDLVKFFNLSQKNSDGCYYDEKDVLVVFDGSETGITDGLLIRKDYLEKYLEDNNLCLFWTCLGEKQYHKNNHSYFWSEWSGFLYLDCGNIIGSVKNIENPKTGKNFSVNEF